MNVSGLVERLRDLHKQATEERSHYYVGKCVRDSIDALEAQAREIERLETRLEVWATNLDGTQRVRTGDSADGIACRDETIQMQRESIDRLKSRLAAAERERDEAVALLREARPELAAYFHGSFGRGERLLVRIDAFLAKLGAKP